MELTQSILSYGLRSTATPTSTNVFNSVEIGVAQTQERFATADVTYSLRAIMAGSGTSLSIAQSTGVCTATAFVTGVAQVETATAAGTVTATGNASVIVISAGMTGSPFTILVPVANGDTASVWAGKVRTYLATVPLITERFTIGGTTTAISLTRLPATVGGTPIYSGNDTTLNIELANGTSTGITAAPLSTNTTLGVHTSGVLLFDGDGKDFEGIALPTMSILYSTMIVCSAGFITYQHTGSGTAKLDVGKHLVSWDAGDLTAGENFVFTVPPVAPAAAEFTFTVLAKI